MSDQLRDKIIEGLGKLTDREKFEACAVELLSKDYPRLVPIPGGSDAGFDGAALGMDGTILQLVCTTGEDVLGNLTGSLEQAKKHGLKSRRVLIATTQALTPQQKRKLGECARKFGKILCPVYDRDALANLLYHDSKRRMSLLGIAGHPPALSLIPVNHRSAFGLSPLGRDEEQAKLRAATGDLVVVGQPGSGKTHLLTHVASVTGGLFVVNSDKTALADGLRDLTPSWVILDDAHSRLDELTALRQMRADLGAGFRIVATCWPGQEDDVSAKLGVTGQEPLKLQGLPMQVIKQVINALDITGPDELVHEILHQSAGKPGLTVTLCQICWQQGTRELFTGEALTRDLKQSLTAIAGADAVYLLGYFALAGNQGLTIEAAADLARLAPPTVARMAEMMGAAGMLESVREKHLIVEPARLRQALVRDVFCRQSASLDWRPLLQAMPSRAESVDTLIAAGLLGGTLDDASLRQEIEGLAGKPKFVKLCDHYARLGPAQGRWVLVAHPELVEEAAEPLLEYLAVETIPLLLRADLALKHRPQQERDELPAIRKWIYKRAHNMDSVSRRLRLLEAVESMRDELRDTPTLLAALRLILANNFERTNQPPGDAATIIFQHGFIPVAALEDIAALWPRILPLLSRLSQANALKLPALFHDWASPRPFGGGEVKPEFVAACQKHGQAMFSDLVRIYSDNWVFLHKCHWVAEHLGLPPPAVPGLAGILFPPRALGKDEEIHQAQRAAVAAIAGDWLPDGPVPERIDQWLRIDREAAEGNANYPNLSNELAEQIAKQAKEPARWLDALLTREASVYLVRPFSDRCAAESVAARLDFVGRFLGHSQYGRLALNYLVCFVPVAHELWQKAGPSISADTIGIGNWVIRNEVPEETLKVLLTAHGPAVAAAVAANLWSAMPKGEIPASLQEAWRQAVIEHLHDRHELDDISRQHSEIGFAWVKKRLNPAKEERYARDYQTRESLQMLASRLSKEQRRELIGLLTSDNYDGALLDSLVGEDLDLFKLAATKPETRKLVGSCLGRPGKPASFWIARVVILLDTGFTEEQVMWATEAGGDGWSGPESRYLEEKLETFRPLLTETDPRIVRIAEMAIARLTKDRDRARERERIAAIKGYLA